ncbi:hypothetical protein SLEP1_g53153 [Rubroshorea leprosula]|uniref:Uncharacterized protein n=1 Tax=Rubroshorea leprosula TaxID=152421 RepID=A0AAV5M8I7_9ROSI|nr:hypothetical protein SLEP1_g53153 [Rubroshorea leprosula]
MDVDPSAFGFLLILASIGSSTNGASTPPSPSDLEFFDIFCFPCSQDGRFVVKGALHHVERDPMIPLVSTKVPLISSSKDGKVVFPLGLAKVFYDLNKLVPWTTIVEVLLSVDDYKAVHTFVIKPSVSIAELIVWENLTKIEKLEKVDKTMKIEKTVVIEKVEKAIGKFKGSAPQGTPLTIRRLIGRLLLLLFFLMMSCNRFSFEGGLLISSVMDFITGKSFSKPSTRSPLKDAVHLGYDIGIDDPSIIGHSSVAHESSKYMLFTSDKKLHSNFPLETLQDMVVHNFSSSFKESSKGRAFVLYGSLGYFNLAIKFIKMLLPHLELIVSNRLFEFEDMDAVVLIHADLELRKAYDQGSGDVSLNDSPGEASKRTSSSWDVRDSTIVVYTKGSFVDAEVSQGASPSSPT